MNLLPPILPGNWKAFFNVAKGKDGVLKVSPKKLLITLLGLWTRRERERKKRRGLKKELGRHIASPFPVHPAVSQRKVITEFMEGGIYKELQKPG